MTKFHKNTDEVKNSNRDQKNIQDTKRTSDTEMKNNKGDSSENTKFQSNKSHQGKEYPGSATRGGQFHSSDKSGQHRDRNRDMSIGKDHNKERSTPRSGK